VDVEDTTDVCAQDYDPRHMSLNERMVLDTSLNTCLEELNLHSKATLMLEAKPVLEECSVRKAIDTADEQDTLVTCVSNCVASVEKFLFLEIWTDSWVLGGAVCRNSIPRSPNSDEAIDCSDVAA
jgi:hypothetical protein